MAQVETVERDTGQVFARITVRPLAGADRSTYLLVLGQAAALPPRPEESVEGDAAKKSAAARGGAVAEPGRPERARHFRGAR